MRPVRAYIGIGSNLGDPVQQVRDVLPNLNCIRDCSLLASSSLYRSEAVSDIRQDDFINAVACVQTSLSPTQLLLELQAIEHAFYRQRDPEPAYGRRTFQPGCLFVRFHHRPATT